MKALSITAQALRFFVDMDWLLLARQKEAVLRLSASHRCSGAEREDKELLDGIINMVDEFQDFAVDGLGIHPDKVFIGIHPDKVFSKEGDNEDLHS